jgi:NitT/TauT family transport system substrate-binding protein
VLAVILLIQTLTIAVPDPPTSPEYLPLRVAAAYGDFAREGLEVTLKPSRSEPAAAEALARAEVNLAATTLDSILRFGAPRGATMPRLAFGLTAAPPVALLASATVEPRIRSVEDLRGLRIAVSTPGAPERAWLTALLTAPPGPPIKANTISVGGRGATALALEQNAAEAALVREPQATDVLGGGQAVMLADLRDPTAVARTIGKPTVNAAVFVHPDRIVAVETLDAFRRALVAAEQRIASMDAAALVVQLPPDVVGVPEEFTRRIETMSRIYLPDGLVTPDQLAASIALIRAHVPLSPTTRIPPADELLIMGTRDRSR